MHHQSPWPGRPQIVHKLESSRFCEHLDLPLTPFRPVKCFIKDKSCVDGLQATHGPMFASGAVSLCVNPDVSLWHRNQLTWSRFIKQDIWVIKESIRGNYNCQTGIFCSVKGKRSFWWRCSIELYATRNRNGVHDGYQHFFFLIKHEEWTAGSVSGC